MSGRIVGPACARGQLPSKLCLTILADVKAPALAKWVERRLRGLYGEVSFGDRDPLETLVATILSQNTTDRNSGRAYASLLARFGTLDHVRTAPVAQIAGAIRIGGLHHAKARAIKGVLGRIARERGRLDLSFLSDLRPEEARAWLLASQGVGDKTAGIVLLFSLRKPYFPVDTHVRRVAMRLGLIDAKRDPHRQMNTLLPKDLALMANLHVHLVRHGREICHPRGPECGRCVLASRCGFPRARNA